VFFVDICCVWLRRGLRVSLVELLLIFGSVALPPPLVSALEPRATAVFVAIKFGELMHSCAVLAEPMGDTMNVDARGQSVRTAGLQLPFRLFTAQNDWYGLLAARNMAVQLRVSGRNTFETGGRRRRLVQADFVVRPNMVATKVSVSQVPVIHDLS